MAAEIEALMLRWLRIRPLARGELLRLVAARYPRVVRDAVERSLLRLIRRGRVADEEGRLRAAPRPILRLRCWYG
jgi:hypothetical protein